MDKPQILIVEDEEIVATDIAESVKELGYSVCGMVSTGEDAVEYASRQEPDLILMDITLAGEMDGISAATEIGNSLGTPVVYLTAHSDEATLQRAKVTEPYGYVLKPFEDIELRIALEIALFKFRDKQISTNESHADADIETETKPLTASDSDGLQGFLSSIEPFSQVPAARLTNFVKQCRRNNYKQGDIVVMEGDESDSTGFIVRSGRVAMLKSSLNGRELIVELLPPGDTFALLAGLERQPFPLTARAQIDAELIHVPRGAFLQLIKSTPELYRVFIEDVTRRLRQSHGISRALAHDRVEVRVASALSKLVTVFCNSVESDEECQTVHITRQELADLTGTTVETAIRTTRAFERSGLLDLSDAGVIRVTNIDELAIIAEQ